MLKDRSFFAALFALLNKARVRYMVVGGMAVNLYGIARSTADIDIFVDLEDGNAGRFVKAMKEAGFKPKIPVRLEDFADKEKRIKWVEEKGMIVFSLYDPKNPFFLLDVFADAPFDFESVFKKIKIKRLGGLNINIPVVPIEELIKMKEALARPQDLADVFYLRKVQGEWKDKG